MAYSEARISLISFKLPSPCRFNLQIRDLPHKTLLAVCTAAALVIKTNYRTCLYENSFNSKGWKFHCSDPHYMPLPNWHIRKISANICHISVTVLYFVCNRFIHICTISARCSQIFCRYVGAPSKYLQSICTIPAYIWHICRKYSKHLQVICCSFADTCSLGIWMPY